MAKVSIDVGPAKAAIREAVKGVSLVVTAAGGDTWQNQGETETVQRDFELRITNYELRITNYELRVTK